MTKYNDARLKQAVRLLLKHRYIYKVDYGFMLSEKMQALVKEEDKAREIRESKAKLPSVS